MNPTDTTIIECTESDASDALMVSFDIVKLDKGDSFFCLIANEINSVNDELDLIDQETEFLIDHSAGID